MLVATGGPVTGLPAVQCLFGWSPVSLPGRWFVPRPGFSSLSRWRTVMTAMRLVLADHPLIGGLFFSSRKWDSPILVVPRQRWPW